MRSNKKNYLSFKSSKEGYTIVESMIFLAVTGAILVSAMLLIGGQQRRSEFNTGIRDIQSQINDIINDVSTGYYNNPTAGLTCPYTSKVSLELGGNPDCVFVGKVIQFGSQENGEDSMEVYTLIGRRQKADNTDLRKLSDAEPQVLDLADATVRLPYGIQVKSVKYTDSNTNYPAGSIGFTSKFAGNIGSGGIVGTQNTDLIAVRNTALAQTKANAKTDIKNLIGDDTFNGYNPDRGITICFMSGGTNQHAEVFIGGLNRQDGTTLVINDGPCI
jgi:hypothetical protein